LGKSNSSEPWFLCLKMERIPQPLGLYIHEVK
jgi:hypothetical protein